MLHANNNSNLNLNSTSVFEIPRDKISESSVEDFFSSPRPHRTFSFAGHPQPSNYRDFPISCHAVDSVDTRTSTRENRDRIFVRAPRRCQDRSPNVRIRRTRRLRWRRYRSAFFDPEEAAILSARRTFFSNVPVDMRIAYRLRWIQVWVSYKTIRRDNEDSLPALHSSMKTCYLYR